MAKAVRLTRTEEKIEIVKVDLPIVTLELSLYEAIALREATSHIVGHDDGPRGAISAVWTSLNALGLGRLATVEFKDHPYGDRLFATGETKKEFDKRLGL